MTEKKFYTKTKSHWDNDNDWNPEAGNGTDTISVNVPNQFTRYRVELLTPAGVSGYQVKSAPRKGSTGKQRFRIKWYYAPFGKVSYRLRAYSGKPKRVEIVVGGHNWLNEIEDAIEQGLEARLVVRGIQARNLYRQILMAAPNDLSVPSDLFFEREETMIPAGDSPVSDSLATDLDDGALTVTQPAAEAATAGSAAAEACCHV